MKLRTNIDAHGLKIQGRGYLMFFAKISRGVKAFRKNCLGGSPYLGFYCIFINKYFKICLRGVLYLSSPLPPPHPPPVCIYANKLCKLRTLVFFRSWENQYLLYWFEFFLQKETRKVGRSTIVNLTIHFFNFVQLCF